MTPHKDWELGKKKCYLMQGKALEMSFELVSGSDGRDLVIFVGV